MHHDERSGGDWRRVGRIVQRWSRWLALTRGGGNSLSVGDPAEDSKGEQQADSEKASTKQYPSSHGKRGCIEPYSRSGETFARFEHHLLLWRVPPRNGIR